MPSPIALPLPQQGMRPGSARPLRFISIGALLGDNESIPSITLPNAFGSGGSKNVAIDKFGRVGSILGYTKQNQSPVVTNTGAAATRLRALFHYGSQAAGVITRQEIGVFDDGSTHWEVRYSTDAGITWTFLADLGTSSVGAIPDFAQSGNTLLVVNGVMSAYTWDGTTFAVASTSQLAAPTITNAGAGVLVGTYQWRVVPINTDGTRKAASAASVVTPLNGAKATVTWVADPDVLVASYEIYRTNGTGLVFYFDGAVVGRTTVTYTTNVDDISLISQRALQEYGDAPPAGIYFCELHNQRMWYGRTNTNPRTWYYADPGLPKSVYTQNNFLDMTDAESISDVGTGGTGNFQGMFVAWLERSIWTISGTGNVFGAITDFQRRRTNARTGTVTHRTVARIPTGAKYIDAEGNRITTGQNTLAYLTPFGDIRLFDGDNDAIISFAKATTLARINYATRAKSFCIPDTPRGEITWVFPADGNVEPSLGVTWNYRYGVWYQRDWTFAHGIEAEESGQASILLAGESALSKGGYCYQLWNGLTNDGAAIGPQFLTKTLYGTGDYSMELSLAGSPLTSYQKRWRWVDLLFEQTGVFSVLVEWLPTEADDSANATGSVTVTPGGIQIQTSDSSNLQSTDSSNLLATTPTITRVKLIDTAGRYLHARGLRLRFSSASGTQQWTLIGILVAYQLLPGLKRSFTQ